MNEKEKSGVQKRTSIATNTLVVLSGKGGVGKSTVAANIAIALGKQGARVGLLDVDIHGPSIPKLLKLENVRMHTKDDRMLPVSFNENVKVISVGFLLSENDAIIWRGPLKAGLIRQFIQEVDWGELDYLVIDSPPGTGDEPLSVCQLLDRIDMAIVVTQPQDLSLLDVSRSIMFCRKVGINLIGLVENMSGFICPCCKSEVDIFKFGGGEKLAAEMGIHFLGRIPLELDIVRSGDEGVPFMLSHGESPTKKAFQKVVDAINAQRASQKSKIPT